MSNSKPKITDSSFISYQHERFETEMCHNIEIFEDRTKAILLDLDEILIKENSFKLNDLKNNLIIHFNSFKNEHFSLIEQIKKFNFENEILIEEFHNQNIKISDLETAKDFLEEKVIKLKSVEISKIHLEETLNSKNKIIEKNEKKISELDKKINLMKIEVEELIIHNEDLQNQVNNLVDKFEKQKLILSKKEKDLNNFKKTIQSKSYALALSNSLTEINPEILFNLEEKILGLSSNEKLFDNSLLLKNDILFKRGFSGNNNHFMSEISEKEGSLIIDSKTQTNMDYNSSDNKISSSEKEKIDLNNSNLKMGKHRQSPKNEFVKDNCISNYELLLEPRNSLKKEKHKIKNENSSINKNNYIKNSIVNSNFTSSIGMEDMGQYNTAVSVNSNTMKKTDCKENNKKLLLIDYMKNSASKNNKKFKKQNENFLSIKKEKNTVNKTQNKNNINFNGNLNKNVLSLEKVLTGFESEEKIDSFNEIKRPKKIEINFNDKIFHENNIENPQLMNLNEVKIKDTFDNMINNYKNSASSKKQEHHHFEQIIKPFQQKNNQNPENNINNNENPISKYKFFEINKEINLYFNQNTASHGKKFFYNKSSQTEANTFTQINISDENTNDELNLNDPLKEFFLLTYQAIKVNYNEYNDNLNMINPDILYQEVMFLNIPFHNVNFF